MLDMLRGLNKEFGQTIVMITHNPEAARLTDRVIEMRDGAHGRIEHKAEGVDNEASADDAEKVSLLVL